MCTGIEAGSPSDGNGIYSGNGTTSGAVEVTLGAGIKFTLSGDSIEIDPSSDSGIIGLREQFSDFIETPTEKTYGFIFNAAYPFDIISFTSITSSGDFSLSLQIDDVGVMGIDAVFVSTTKTTEIANGSNSVLKDSKVTLVVSTALSPENWDFTMETIRT